MNAHQAPAIAATGQGSSGAKGAASRAAFLAAIASPAAALPGPAALRGSAAPRGGALLRGASALRLTALRVVVISVLAALAAAEVAVSAEPVGAGKSDALHVGELVYEKWCAPCHAPGPDHPGTQALDALYKGSKPGALVERTDLTPPIIKQFVRNGVSVMPFFRKTEISDAELDALAAFLSKQK